MSSYADAIKAIIPGANCVIQFDADGNLVNIICENVTDDELSEKGCIAPFTALIAKKQELDSLELQKPYWDGFIDALSAIPGFMALLATHPFAGPVVARMGDLGAGAQWKGSDDRLIAWWNASPLSVSVEMRQAMQQAATDNHVPLSIAETGQIELA